MSWPSPEERRQRFVEAAVEVIMRQGAAKATTRAVAEAAGEPLGALHKAFRYKENLFGAVTEYILDQVERESREHVEPDSGLEATVIRLFELNFDWSREEPNSHLAEYELVNWALRTPSSRDLARQIYNRWFDVIRRILAEAAGEPDDPDGPLDVLARDVVSGLTGMILQVIALGDDGPSREDCKRLAKAALSSVGAAK